MKRLVSLDVFRGITIAGMILVNNPGTWSDVYGPLRHAEWHGCTPTDLVFPFFLFIVGVAMTYSFPKQQETLGTGQIYLRVLKRSAIIFGLGIFLALFPKFDFANLRIAGVLQRIGIVYGLASIVVLNTRVVGQAVVAGALLLAYWAAMALVPVPEHGAGVLTPEGNLAGYLDSLYLPGRKYQVTWDPEGLLSTIPAISTALLGVLTGHWLRSGRGPNQLVGGLLGSGALLLAIGWLWGQWFPINKHIWTSSYVVYTAGAAQIFLAVCYWLCDVADLRKWFYPAIVFGVNPIAVYVLSGMLGRILGLWMVGDPSVSMKEWLYTNAFASWAPPLQASLGFALCYVLFWYVVMDVFYRRKIFIKV